MANKKINTLDASINHNSTYQRNPTDYFLDVYQSKLDEDWESYANVYDVEIEEPYGSQTYIPYRVRISDVSASTFGFNFSDDYKQISFKSSQDVHGLGTLYKFDDNYWLTVNPELIKQVANSVIVQRCNNVFKWKDKVTGSVVSEPVVIYNKMLGNTGMDKMYLTLPKGYERIYAQHNTRTSKILPNQRFMVGNTGFWNIFRISGGGITNFLNQKTTSNDGNSVIVFTATVDFVDYAVDDVANGVADMYVIDPTPDSTPVPVPGSTYITLSPSVNEIKQGATTVYTAKLYLAGVLHATSFTFENSNVDEKYYDFNVIDTQSFSIKNIHMYMNKPIQVKCSCTHKESTFDLWLIGW
jgi:hypothetical protein